MGNSPAEKPDEGWQAYASEDQFDLVANWNGLAEDGA